MSDFNFNDEIIRPPDNTITEILVNDYNYNNYNINYDNINIIHNDYDENDYENDLQLAINESIKEHE